MRETVHEELLFPLAKLRDVTHNKLESEVVPKVARMTVSGKKQTMGFDVPRYRTHTSAHKHASDCIQT